MTAIPTVFLCTSLALLGTSVPANAQRVNCKDMAPALLKQTTIPYHAYMTTTAGYAGNKPRQSEVVSTGSAMYVMTNGKWTKSPISPQQLAKTQRELADSVSRNYTCTRVGGEAVNGVRTQRYHIEGKNEAGEIKEDLWIDASGRVQKLEMDQDVGGGAAGRSHASMRYDYANVEAPPGVK
jgi:hypothetical protein